MREFPEQFATLAQRIVDTKKATPHKSVFILSGPVGVGKTSGGIAQAAVQLASAVEPTLIRGRKVRKVTGLILGESQALACNRLFAAFEATYFPPEAMYSSTPPMRKHGQNPILVDIIFDLPDQTRLELTMECHGFKIDADAERLKSTNVMFALCSEVQQIPYMAIDTARQRCGRYQPDTIKLTLGGKSLTGQAETQIVICDINIPARTASGRREVHWLYEHIFDNPNIEDSPFEVVDLPGILLPVPVTKLTERALEMKEMIPGTGIPVRRTRFEGQEVQWFPNKAAYAFTRHFEAKDEKGQPVPGSGYAYWVNELHNADDHIRRLVMAKPSSIGGGLAYYHFNLDAEGSVPEPRPRKEVRRLLIGVDVGNNSNFVLIDATDPDRPHVCDNFYFDVEDNLKFDVMLETVEHHVKTLYAPNLYVEAEVVLDPAADANSANAELSFLQLTKRTFPRAMLCPVPNQNTQDRKRMPASFIDTGQLTVGKSAREVALGLAGGYAKMTTRLGVPTGKPIKNQYSHIVESLEYALCHLYLANFRKKRKRQTIKSAVARW